ncbi:hypothetical protein J6590_036106 [Homalodisca vitripennis]|nr:hypothetical protein J6590_036106 [Homalodisca vitripennis]
MSQDSLSEHDPEELGSVVQKKTAQNDTTVSSFTALAVKLRSKCTCNFRLTFWRRNQVEVSIVGISGKKQRLKKPNDPTTAIMTSGTHEDPVSVKQKSLLTT